MIDLRFVGRKKIETFYSPISGQLDYATETETKILQWRQCDNLLEVINGLQDAIWTDWTDIRIEEEHLSNTDDRA